MNQPIKIITEVIIPGIQSIQNLFDQGKIGKSELNFIQKIISNSNHNTQLIGYLNQKGENGALGSFSELKKVIKKHKIDEVVFASLDINFKDIIKWLISLSGTSLNFKILPENSHFLIGSNSRETLGDYYSPDSNCVAEHYRPFASYRGHSMG